MSEFEKLLDTPRYVVVSERDCSVSMEKKLKVKSSPIIWETMLDCASLEEAKERARGYGDRFGKIKIARLVFVEDEG